VNVWIVVDAISALRDEALLLFAGLSGFIAVSIVIEVRIELRIAGGFGLVVAHAVG
jgi:hypothetical protein